MEYIKVIWRHDFKDEPVLLYSELDDARWEVRKVEVFRDGTYGYAGDEQEYRSGLGLVPVPSLAEIARDPEFEPSQISNAEFEAVWLAAHENT
jgi:hypothetical protein